MKKVKVSANKTVKIKDKSGKEIFNKKLKKNKEVIAPDNFEITVE